MPFYRILIIILFFINIAFCQIIEVKKNTEYKEILSKSFILIDRTNNLKITDILKEKQKFLINNNKTLSYGYAPEFSVWVKFTLENKSNSNIKKVIEYDNALASNVIFYNPEIKYKESYDGMFHLSKKRINLKPTFHIELAPYEKKTYYIKTYSNITTLIIKLNLWNEKAFYHKELNHKFYLGLFFGTMIILILYNLFIFFFTRDISYLYYILYIFFMSFHHSFYVGLSRIILEQKTLIIAVQWSSLIVVLPVIFLALFTKSFLNSSQYKYWDKALIYLTTASFLFALFISLSQSFLYLRSSLTLILLLFLLIFTIYAAFKKNRAAYFILFGWFILFIATLLMVLSSSGVFNIYEYIAYPVEVAFVLEATIFSIALADRINTLRDSKEELQEKIIYQKTTENERLEEKVTLKTHSLQVALEEKNLLLKELNHRVKNNMQMIISLLRLQPANGDLNEIITTIQNRISAMSHLHELLYKQENIVEIDTYEYFYLLCNELKYSYDNDEKVIIDLDINANIDIEDSIYCGLILNELLTNSYKYAFPNKDGNIKIELNKADDMYELRVSDNGICYSAQNFKEGLGTIIINSLVVEQLNGTITSSSEKGITNIIKWSVNA